MHGKSGDLNYRTSIRVKGGIDEKVKEGYKKVLPAPSQAHSSQDQA